MRLVLVLITALSALGGCTATDGTERVTAPPVATAEDTADTARKAGAQPRPSQGAVTPTSPVAPATPSPPDAGEPPSAAPAAPPETSLAPACESRALTVSQGETRWLAHLADRSTERATDIVLLNTSAATCSLHGWAGITMRGNNIKPDSSDEGGQDLDSIARPAPVPMGDTAPVVELAPGDTTAFSIVSWCCNEEFSLSPYRAEIRLPGDARALELVFDYDAPGIAGDGKAVRASLVSAFGAPYLRRPASLSTPPANRG